MAGGGGGGNQNFTNASLKGQYVFTLTWRWIRPISLRHSFLFVEGGVFTADGNGNLTVIIDDFDPECGLPF